MKSNLSLGFSNWVTKRYVDLLLALLLPTCLVVGMLSPLLFRPGYLFYGDQLPFIQPSFDGLLNGAYIWNQVAQDPNTLIIDYFPLYSLANLFGVGPATRICAVLFAMAPAPAMYVAARILVREWWPRTSVAIARAGAATAAMLYLLAPTNVSLYGSILSTWTPAYAATPLLLALFVRYIHSAGIWDLIAIGAISSLANPVPAWLLFLPISAGTYVLGRLLLNPKVLPQTIKRTAVVIAATVSLNAYVLVPAFLGFALHLGGEFASYAPGTVSGSAITLAQLRTMSVSSMLDALLLGHSSFSSFTYSPQNWTLLSLILPVLAFGGLLVRRRPVILYCASLLLWGVFLAKGVNDPFGSVYLEIARYSPGGISGIVFDVTPFLDLAALGFALSIAFTAIMLGEAIQQGWRFKIIRQNQVIAASLFRGPSRRSPFVGPVAIAILIVVSSSVLVVGNANSLSEVNYLFGPQHIPDSYLTAANYVDSQGPGTRVMWIPTAWSTGGVGGTVGVNWTIPPNADTGGNFPSTFSTLPSVAPTIIPLLPLTNKIGEVLALMDVKFVIVHNDTTANVNEILHELNSQADMRLVMTDQNISVFENEEPTSYAWAGNMTYVVGPSVTSAQLIAAGLQPNSSIWDFSYNQTVSEEVPAHLESGAIIDSPNELAEIPSSLPVGWVGDPNTTTSGLPSLPSPPPVASVIYPETVLGDNASYNATYLVQTNNTPLIPGHNETIELSYHLPEAAIKGGYVGNFTPGYGFTFAAFLGGNPYERIATMSPTNQSLINQTTGTFELKFQIPSTLSAPFTIWYFFFGPPGFTALTPWCYLGTYYPSVAGITEDPESSLPALFVEGTGVPVKLFAPSTDDYNVSLFASGNFTIENNSSVKSISAPTTTDVELGHIYLTQGWNSFTIRSERYSYLDLASVLPTSWPSQHLVPLPVSSPNPTLFELSRVPSPTVVEFSQQPSPGWQASGGGKVFSLGDSGSFGVLVLGGPSLSISFYPQVYVYWSDAFSVGVGVALSAYALTILFRRARPSTISAKSRLTTWSTERQRLLRRDRFSRGEKMPKQADESHSPSGPPDQNHP